MRIKSLCITFVESSYCKVKTSGKKAEACINHVKLTIFGKSDFYPSRGNRRYNSPHKHKTLLYVPFICTCIDNVGFVVDEMAMGFVEPSISSFLCRHYST